MPSLHPALWRGCQIIKRCYEMVPALTKLIIKLCKGAQDPAKAGCRLLPTQLGLGSGHCCSPLISLPLPHITQKSSRPPHAAPCKLPPQERSNPLRVWDIPLYVTESHSYDNVKGTHPLLGPSPSASFLASPVSLRGLPCF